MMYSYIYIYVHTAHISVVSILPRKKSACPVDLSSLWLATWFFLADITPESKQHGTTFTIIFILYFLSLFFIMLHILLHILLHISIYRYILYDLIFYMFFDDKKQFHSFIIYYIFLHYPTYLIYYVWFYMFFFFLLFYDKQLNHTISRPFSWGTCWVPWVPLIFHGIWWEYHRDNLAKSKQSHCPCLFTHWTTAELKNSTQVVNWVPVTGFCWVKKTHTCATKPSNFNMGHIRALQWHTSLEHLEGG